MFYYRLGHYSSVNVSLFNKNLKFFHLSTDLHYFQRVNITNIILNKFQMFALRLQTKIVY